MIKNYACNLVVICCLFFVLFSYSSYAFLRVDETSDNKFFNKERTIQSKKKNENNFVVYDNICSIPLANPQKQILFQRSAHFVPADVIECDIPLKIVIPQSTSMEDSLADMLYANLKLKKLMDEYNALNQKTNEIVNNSSSLSIGFNFSLPRIHFQNSIHRSWHNIRAEHQQINNNSDNTVIHLRNPEIFQIAENDSTLQSKEISLQPSFENANINRKAEIKNTWQEEQIRPSDNPPPKPHQRNQLKTSTNGSYFDFGDWLFKMVSNFSAYCRENRTETLIYLCIMLLFINIITSMMRHRK